MSTPTATPVQRRTPEAAPPASVFIIGAGFAGLGAAIRLKQAGITEIIILERGTRVGGTWRDNTYPGAACDIPSLLYSYSFVPNPDWPQGYSGSRDILGYIEHMVEAFDLREVIRFGHEVAQLSLMRPTESGRRRRRPGRQCTPRR